MSEQELEKKQVMPWENAISSAKKRFNEINKIHNFVNYDKEAMFAWQIVKNNDYLMGVANTNPESLRNAVINVAAIGLSLNPAEKLAYLVPRKIGQKDDRGNKIMSACLDISYIGMIKLATDTGSILWARAELIHENDAFTYHGATKEPELICPSPFDRGSILGVYCTAKTKEGDYLSGIMSIDEINDIRDRSEAFKKGYGPWVSDYGEMVKKTIIKRESKTWPKTEKSGRFDDAIEYLNDHNEEGIDFTNQIAPEPIDHQRVEEAYVKAIEIIDSDNKDWGSEAARELFQSLTMDEQRTLQNKLQSYKPGTRQYNTIWKEYLEHCAEPALPEHVEL